MRSHSLVELETPRLTLRQWCAADRAPFAALNADAEVMRYFPATLDRAGSDLLAERCEQLIAERGWGFWVAEHREDGAFIGFVGLHEVAADLPLPPGIEIGWRLARPYWGQGLATEAARACLRFGFEQLQRSEIVAFTAVSNRRSRAVMQRLGMQCAHAYFDHPHVPAETGLQRHCLYRLSQVDWRRDKA